VTISIGFQGFGNSNIQIKYLIKSWKSSNPGHPDSDKKGLKDKQDKVFN
jgi:hypothetical protein